MPPTLIGLVLGEAGRIELLKGDLSSTAIFFSQGNKILQDHGHMLTRTLSIRDLALLAAPQGDIQEARSLSATCLAIRQ